MKAIKGYSIFNCTPCEGGLDIFYCHLPMQFKFSCTPYHYFSISLSLKIKGNAKKKLKLFISQKLFSVSQIFPHFFNDQCTGASKK